MAGRIKMTLLAGAGLAALMAAGPARAAEGGLWTRDTLLGDLGGLKPALAQHGVSLSLSETSEVQGNATGGMRQGALYDGLTQFGVTVDTAKAFGWAGGTIAATGLQIHGRNLSAENLGSLQTASGIEAARATRLWELWYQQALFNGRADIRIGQLTADTEFKVSKSSGLFVNTAMGWPLLPSLDLSSGGPAYPLSSPAVRVRVHATPALTVLAGVYDDNPTGGPFNSSQLLSNEMSGTRFSLNSGALWIGEVQYAAHQSPDPRCTTVACGLPGTFKLGGWYDSGGIPDMRTDTNGASLASPFSTGTPRNDRGDYSIYAVADQTVWRAGPNSPQSLTLFARPMWAPGDRNLITFSVNAGATLSAPIPGRDNDTLGLGMGFGQVGSGAVELDRDQNRFNGTNDPVRSSETFIELTYQAQITPWWTLQPDLQYVVNPGAGQDPTNTSRSLGNEVVLGLRTTITFE